MRITTKTEFHVTCDPGTDDVEGIAQAIRSLGVKGIGKVLSHKLAAIYGRGVFDKLLRECGDVVYYVDGIGNERAGHLQAAVRERFGPELKRRERERNERHMRYEAFMGSIGVKGFVKHLIEDKFKDMDADEIEHAIRENPYQLTDIDDIGFTRADKIAEKLGVNKDHPDRLKEGVMYEMQQMNGNGHCFVPEDKLLKMSVALLKQPDELVTDAMTALEDAGRIVNDEGNIYPNKLYHDEVNVAQTLRRLMEASGLPPSKFTEWGRKLHEALEEEDPLWQYRQKRQTVEYNEQQQEAIRMARMFRVMIMTGGPGTGKTTTLLGILNEAKQSGYIVKLCAPTGKAAQRMKESTGEDAQTIHRLLSYHPDEGFRKNRHEPLECDVVVVDEASMIDITLMRHLCDAIPYGGRLIIVGDADQLQSVGPGNVLRDLIESGAIPTARLTQIHRQQAGSHIVENAHRVINGQMPVVDNMAGSDFFIKVAKEDEQGNRVPLTEADVLEEITTMVSDRLPKAYPDMEVQVLCPRRSDLDTSSDKLNPEIQKVVNPYGRIMRWAGREFRQGDRMMQMKNDYDLNRFNGDTGTITDMVPDANSLTVEYQDGKTIYEDSQLRNLQLCYATTIHKSQGSEYDIVVIPMLENAYTMLQRNLLYTAITRAKKVCIIVGTWRAIQIAVQNWMVQPRWTGLKERIKN